MSSRRGDLVGRSAELGLLEARLRAVPTRPVVLGGHAGVGKTRLAREVAAGWPVADGTAWISGTASASGLPGAALLRFLAGPVPEPGPGSDAGLVRAALDEVRAHPARLVVVDDLHDLDALSALFVQQVALEGAAPVLATLRSGAAIHPVLRALWEDGHAERIDVQPLSSAETADLCVSLLGEAVDEASLQALYGSSHGNPLLVAELLRDAGDAGALRPGPDGLRWDGGIGRARRLREVIGQRLADLGEHARDLMATVAVAQPVGLRLLAELHPEVDLGEAEARGLIQVDEHRSRAEVHVAHPLLGEILLADADPVWLARLRVRVADAIEAKGARRRGDLLLVAHLRLEAGDTSDPERLLQGAGRAAELWHPELALRLATAALEADPSSVTARILLGEIGNALRRERDAVEHFGLAARAATSDYERLRAAQGLQQSYRLLGEGERVRPMLEEIRAGMGEGRWRAVLDCLECQQLMFEGRSREGLALGEQVLAEHDDPEVHVRLLGTVATGWALGGRTEEALAEVERQFPVALSLQAELPLAPSWAINAQGLALMLAGRLDDAMGLVDLVASIARAQHVALVSPGMPMLEVFAGRIELARGNAPAAVAHLRTARAQLGDDDVSGLSPWAASLLAEALALAGEQAEAAALADRARVATSTMRMYEGDAARARAWVAALGGGLQRAVDDLVHLAALQELEGQHALELVTLHHALRLGGGPSVRRRLAAVLPLVDGRYPEVYRAHLEALVADDPAALEAAGTGFVEAGLLLDGAEALAGAARGFDRAGLRSRAAAALRRSEELLSRCGAVRTPALRHDVRRAELTQREHEVVALAARGLSNREIADQLYVSVRTAEGHLYRACTKLGVTDRAELAALFPANA